MTRKITVSIDPPRTEDLVMRLAELWRASVAATHHFLTEEDITSLLPEVACGLRGVERLLVAFEDAESAGSSQSETRPIGFMGIDGDKVEMLFVTPGRFGCGIGRRLMCMAVEQFGVRRVDVNEQNPGAAEFYRRMGFVLSRRTPTDSQGRPFPILELKLK